MYESSMELLISDEEETEQQNINVKSTTITPSKMDQSKDVPKRKLKSKLNL